MEKSPGSVLLEQPGYKKGETSVYESVGWNIIAGLLRFTLGLWTGRCNSTHGIDDAENKKERKKKLAETIKVSYQYKEGIPDEAQYSFEKKYRKLCKRSLQYLKKLVTSYNSVVKGGGEQKKNRKLGRGKGARQREMESETMCGNTRKVCPYSEQHTECQDRGQNMDEGHNMDG